MRAIIIPKERVAEFDVWIIPGIWRVGPVKIKDGDLAGSYFVNAAIADASPEFKLSGGEKPATDVLFQKSKRLPVAPQYSDIAVMTIDPSDFTKPVEAEAQEPPN